MIDSSSASLQKELHNFVLYFLVSLWNPIDFLSICKSRNNLVSYLWPLFTMFDMHLMMLSLVYRIYGKIHWKILLNSSQQLPLYCFCLWFSVLCDDSTWNDDIEVGNILIIKYAQESMLLWINSVYCSKHFSTFIPKILIT